MLDFDSIRQKISQQLPANKGMNSVALCGDSKEVPFEVLYERFLERCSILEYDAGYSREKATAMALAEIQERYSIRLIHN